VYTTLDKANNWRLTTRSLTKMSKKQDAHRKRMASFTPITVEQRQETEQEQLVGYWIAKWGMKRHDLLQHPCIDDLILLINFRQEFWHQMNRNTQAQWGAFWGYTYAKRKPLKNKSLKKLESIITNIQYRQNKIAQQRQIIRTLKQKEDHDMTAKGSSNADNIPWESE